MAINMAESRQPETAFLNPEVFTVDVADMPTLSTCIIGLRTCTNIEEATDFLAVRRDNLAMGTASVAVLDAIRALSGYITLTGDVQGAAEYMGYKVVEDDEEDDERFLAGCADISWKNSEIKDVEEYPEGFPITEPTWRDSPAQTRIRRRTATPSAKVAAGTFRAEVEGQGQDQAQERRVKMRQLLSSRRWRLCSGEGLREMSSVMLEAGKLAVGSVEMAETVYESVVQRAAERLADKRKLKEQWERNQRSDYSLRGARKTISELNRVRRSQDAWDRLETVSNQINLTLTTE